MNKSVIEKIVTLALHPTTSEEEALAAFRKLHQLAHEHGGLNVILAGGHAGLRSRLNEAEGRIRELEAEKQEIKRNLECERQKAHAREDRLTESIAALRRVEAELVEAKGRGGGDELGIIAQRNVEIAVLASKCKALNAKVEEVKSSRDQYAAQKAAEAEHAIAEKVLAIFGSGQPKTKAEPEPEIAPTHDDTAKSAAEAARAKLRRARRSAHHAQRKGADTDRIVLDLLTYEWKSVSTLFKAARSCGFTGTENAIRFAAERLVREGNAEQGRNHRGYIAFRRA